MTMNLGQHEFRRPAGIEAYPDLAKLVDYCQLLADDCDLPHRKDFLPSRVRWMFGHLYLVDVLEGGADYRCRVWGQFWEAIFGCDLQGKLLSDLERAGHVLHLRAIYDDIVATRQMHLRSGQVVWPDDKAVRFVRVIIPFAGDDGNVSMLLGGATSQMSSDDLVYFKGLGMPRFSLDE
jgi:hypothetical protein